MSITLEAPPAAGRRLLSTEDVRQFLYREARCLDDRDWDGWLAHYAPDVEFWMPAWDDDDGLTEDPQSEISLIWYGNKGGLQDRVFRIRTERSSATSLPEPRTSLSWRKLEEDEEPPTTVTSSTGRWRLEAGAGTTVTSRGAAAGGGVAGRGGGVKPLLSGRLCSGMVVI